MQVMKSDLLPPSVADEQINDLLRAIPEHPGMLERVIDSLFALSATPTSPTNENGPPGQGQADSLPILADSWRRAHPGSPGMPELRDNPALSAVLASVHAICAVHGAVQMSSSLV
jgi:hypothetical protein